MVTENSSEKKKVEEDPGVSIKKILGIVDSLHTYFPTQSEEERKSRNIPVRSKTLPAVPTSERPTLVTEKSVPVDTSKQGESETSIPKLKRNLHLLKEDVLKVQELNLEVGEEVSRHIRPLEKLLKKVEVSSSKKELTKGMKKDLDDINKKIFNLMCQVPLLPNKRKKAKGLDSDDADGDNNGKGIVCLPGIHAIEDLKTLAAFKTVQREFEKLDDIQQIYLLSFAAFPENQEVNRTMLMYWWMGEGILSSQHIKSEKGIRKPEDVVKEILDDFVKKNLIEPVEIKRKVKPSSYKMAPFVHSSVVRIAKEIGLFHMYDQKNKPYMKQSLLEKVCLVEASSSQPEAKATKMTNAEQIETVFNVSERFPDFTFKWFSKDQPSVTKKFGPLSKITYGSLKVFYLGRWERTAKRHIEVENPELMKNLKYMTKLRLLSFQGVSRIERLDDAVCKLRELIILDLRACYNLEKLPDKIDALKALIYLDITDCYMIDRMPKRLSWLDNLEVLKGFVVSDATDEETVCTLTELVHLKKLRKLSISINKGDFTIDDVFKAVKDFETLEKLKVAWGGINTHPQDKKEQKAGLLQRTATRIFGPDKDLRIPQLPTTLKKLDLQCFPDAALPPWLEPNNLGGLEKLYIKGGTELTGFGKSLPKEPTRCQVTVLRLKFLPRLKVEWRDLTELYFPKLEFLDKYQCPQVSLCPCDGMGIWRKP
ncbi:Disease resistance RPP13-like protein 4 [Cardamine amara subsp. amara]|uniref:Disease resistance RPP13-like protein 4 n=1 Tax=Cardamine amara subsp. amara TaxID=228776 RepID=A0ABD1C924_CARAN